MVSTAYYAARLEVIVATNLSRSPLYNLIMSYDDSNWNIAVGTVGRSSFSLSRYLEYTDPSIEERLKPISPYTLGIISDIPALFVSEIKSNRHADNQEYLTIRAGRVWDLSVVGDEIQYKFRIDHSFGDVPIDNRRNFELAFELGRWELSRTHWAIKQGDLNQALIRVGLHAAPNGTSLDIRERIPQSGAPSLEPLVVSSVNEYLERVLSINPTWDEEIFYRGHSDRRYRLEPTLFRRNERGDYRYRQAEATLVREILTAQATEFSSDQYMLDRLVRMQHYGLPTRLLDVTSNPLIALYFCCSSQKQDSDGNEIDGEVVLLKAKSENVMFFDSDTVSCIANICLMTEVDQRGLDTSQSIEYFNNTPSSKKLLHFIRREKPYFEGRINPRDLDRILLVRGRNTNERIISQSGAFLLFGKEAVLPETGYSSLSLLRIIVRNKAKILDQLTKLNIKSSTVYPGIEKASAEIASKYEVD